LAIGSPPREGQAFLLKLDPDTSLGEALDQLAQVIQIAGQPIHAVDDDGIAFAGESEQSLKLGRLTSLPDALSVKVRSSD
jgi:predicted DNA-binding protein with PD1-like motif